jgi:hypothetical protein
MNQREFNRRRRELRSLARELQDRYTELIERLDSEAEFEVRASPRRLSASVWWGTNVYDHIDIDLDKPRGFLRWKEVRTPPEARSLVEAEIRKWMKEGPPAISS